MFWKRGAHAVGFARCRNFSNLRKPPPSSPIPRPPDSADHTHEPSHDDPTPASTENPAKFDGSPHRIQQLENVKVLGKPAHVVIVDNKPRRPRDVVQAANGKSSWKSPTELLKDLQNERVEFELEEVEKNLDHLRALYNPGDTLLPKDWKHLHNKLSDGFTFEQLRKYYQNTERNTDSKKSSEWRAGNSSYLDQPPAPQGRITSRIPAFKEMGPKKKLVERILRESWELSIDGEEGQLDIHLDTRPMSVLLLPTMPLLNMFAESHKVNIDVSRHLGLIRITGSKEACMGTSQQLKEWASDVRSIDTGLSVAQLKATADLNYWENTLLPWLQSEYNVSFDIGREHGAVNIHYFHDNKFNAHRARRTLYLAASSLHQKGGLFTNLTNSENAHIYPVFYSDSMDLPNRQKEWFRWIKSGDSDGRVPGRPPASIYGKGSVKPFHKLLELLFDGDVLSNQRLLDQHRTREVITASVGQCLFEGGPTHDSGQASFSNIENLQTPRIFINEVPNTLAFLDSLEAAPNDDNKNTFRIRLLPSRKEQPFLPELELELEAASLEDCEETSTIPTIRNISAIVSSRNVDMLLPESPVDIRFNKTVYYNLFNRDCVEYISTEADNVLHSSLLRSAETFKLNLPLTRNQPSMPLFCNLEIPKIVAELLDPAREPSQRAPAQSTQELEYVTGEYYVYPPVQSLAEASVSKYIYKELDLTFGTRDMGPYLPTKTTEISLTLGLYDDERRPQNALPNRKLSSLPQTDSSIGSLQSALLPFYLRSCHLAFGFAALQQQSDRDMSDQKIFDESLLEKNLDRRDT
ncbi:hypothetical protein H109_05536 [Trichophyton interdigitale MR816]|uniref:Respiratory complex assembly protein Rmp1 n=1 Tax=Trichophyton interdigitale (strain MR816) TaxID=1215338 RepID=A0A059J4C1_TRIIM|nr:hypothetical protein H101_02757 [Trichophyton interdigitale H6]KDB22543.1 hypothetical protein H109_05536 [Trichophyton interdigitale MR816]